MVKRALGLIEVRGYLGAVVAADHALKAANVSLLNVERIGAGLNTVQLLGDVSAVRAAVDAAVQLIGDEPYYMTSHVISRLDGQTTQLFSTRGKEEKEEREVPLLKVSKTIVEPLSFPTEEVSDKKAKYSLKNLEKKKVVELRSLAYREKEIRLTKKEIKFAGKNLLLDALLMIKAKGE